ncbi:MAG TPA: SAM hydroxide adenosyltransferase [Candidatus Acidoferrum sp.]|nr:SAM hydroxide adenosyltransferase [Candidatus Acidoferrum sp.]
MSFNAQRERARGRLAGFQHPRRRLPRARLRRRRQGGKTLVLPFGKTFMDVPVGDSLLYQDSRGRIGIAINQGNYSKKFGIEPPAKIFIPRKGAAIGKSH